MSCYVGSNNNRFYVALESTFGTVPAVTAQHRVPGLRLQARQVAEDIQRRDKTGSRTFTGLPNKVRRNTAYQFNTLMTQWLDQSEPPSIGPLFQAGMGAAPVVFDGGTVDSTTGLTGITLTTAHELSTGQGVAFEGEIRFVSAVQDATTFFVNAPFTNLGAASVLGTTITYKLATTLASTSIFDYWDPTEAVQRIVEGAVVDTFRVNINGDFHEFAFSGPARDLIDSASFETGEGELTTFPEEPGLGGFDYTVIPGHLGQVWMGATPIQFFTITEAELSLQNDVALRVKEFGSDLARCFAAGKRKVQLNIRLFEDLDGDAAGLYQAARSRSPISVMLQLGQQSGQLFGAYMPAMVPTVPEFDDQDTRLQWRFQNSRAQGTVDDELYIAFG